MGNGKVFGVNVVVGIPTFGMISHYFYQARQAQQFPLVSSAVDKIVTNKPIAEARNEIVQYALDQGANYIFWLDDDVIAPPDAFLKLYMHQKDIINGVYWSKSNPPMPLLFRNHLEGPYMDWHIGDFIEIDAAGNGLTLVKTDVYRKMEKELGGPWYSTEYASFKNATNSPSNNTEDLYFYWKARKLGYQVWADTSIQAYHYEKYSDVLYGMPNNARQGNPAWNIKVPGKKLIADLGSGPVSPQFDDGKVISFDIREEVKPDVICDLRRIPVPDQVFDIVFSSHTLEHFSFQALDKIIKEWTRILKVGGELRLIVPNLRYVAKRLYEDKVQPTDLWVMYGEQDYSKNFHAAGFTPNILKSLIAATGLFEDIEIAEGDINTNEANPIAWNLQLRAKKVKHPVIENITPDYIEAPTGEGAMWPMRLFQTYNERPLTPDEIYKDKVKWLDTPAEDVTVRPEMDLFAPDLGGVLESDKSPEPTEDVNQRIEAIMEEVRKQG